MDKEIWSGVRGSKDRVGKKLKKKEIGEVRTDHWRAYAQFLPEKIHAQSKVETYTVEGYNSI